MNECWCALALAIMSERYCTPEFAFASLNAGQVVKYNNTITADDYTDMLAMRESKMKYQEIADIYGEPMNHLWKRIKKFERRQLT